MQVPPPLATPLTALPPRRYAAYMELFDPLCGPAGPSRPLMVGEGSEGGARVGQKRAREGDAAADLELPTPKKRIRLGLPATQWITVYNAHRPMKQRYHYNVANNRVQQHVEKGNDDGLYISSVACCQDLWALIMDAGTGFAQQVYDLSNQVGLGEGVCVCGGGGRGIGLVGVNRAAVSAHWAAHWARHPPTCTFPPNTPSSCPRTGSWSGGRRATTSPPWLAPPPALPSSS